MDAHQLHRQAIVIDGHSDILNLLADRRLRLCEHPDLPPPEDEGRPQNMRNGDSAAIIPLSSLSCVESLHNAPGIFTQLSLCEMTRSARSRSKGAAHADIFGDERILALSTARTAKDIAQGCYDN